MHRYGQIHTDMHRYKHVLGIWTKSFLTIHSGVSIVVKAVALHGNFFGSIPDGVMGILEFLGLSKSTLFEYCPPHPTPILSDLYIWTEFDRYTRSLQMQTYKQK